VFIEFGAGGRTRTGKETFASSAVPAITGPSRDKQRNRLKNGHFPMFRQVGTYSVTTHQRVGKNSFKTALLALLLALKPAISRFSLLIS
jgi:hypothetical protein